MGKKDGESNVIFFGMGGLDLLYFVVLQNTFIINCISVIYPFVFLRNTDFDQFYYGSYVCIIIS